MQFKRAADGYSCFIRCSGAARCAFFRRRAISDMPHAFLLAFTALLRVECARLNWSVVRRWVPTLAVLPVAMMTEGGFEEFFRAATDREPYDYQRRLAGDPSVSDAILDGPKSLAINVPTGAGKTAEGRE
ncbi:MAG: hypothetical protein ACHQ4J_11770 [Candidatus Binatia bacterium]